MPSPRILVDPRRASIGGFAWCLLTATAAAQATTERASVDSSGVQGNGESIVSALSADGRIVAFRSAASNLVAGDKNNSTDVFVHDRSTGITERVSVDSSGNEGNDDSAIWGNAISADGQIVAFSSYADNLVAGDTNGCWDVFVHDRSTGITERVSVDSSGGQAHFNSGNYGAAISADGSVVVFASDAPLVSGDTNGAMDVFVHELATGVTERVSVDSSGNQSDNLSVFAAISADGQIVAFESFASNLVANDTNFVSDIFVRDRALGTTERVSVRTNGAQANDQSEHPAISADGQVVAFASYATNLVNADGNGREDVFVRDRANATTRRLSVDSAGAEAHAESTQPSISADGLVVAFASLADNLVAGDGNVTWDIFVRDRAADSTERVSVDSSGAEANGESYVASISADGQVASFGSIASNLVVGDSNGVRDVFVHERCLIDATWSNYGAGFPGTNGVPAFTAQADPVLGTTLTLDLANSSGTYTFGLLFLGFQQATIHSVWGGDLLVLPVITQVLGLAPTGTTLVGNIPDDDKYCGSTIDLQAIESDPGAAHGVSFTPGIELLLGH